jgi:hypothetical protein
VASVVASESAEQRRRREFNAARAKGHRWYFGLDPIAHTARHGKVKRRSNGDVAMTLRSNHGLAKKFLMRAEDVRLLARERGQTVGHSLSSVRPREHRSSGSSRSALRHAVRLADQAPGVRLGTMTNVQL